MEYDWLNPDPAPSDVEAGRIARSISAGSEVKVGLIGKPRSRVASAARRDLWLWVEVEYVVDLGAAGRRVFGTVAEDFKGCDFVPLVRCDLGDRVTFPAAKVLTTVGNEHEEPTAAVIAAAGLRGRVFQAGGLRTLRQRRSIRKELEEMNDGLTIKAITELLDSTGCLDHRKRGKYDNRPTKDALLHMLQHQLALEAEAAKNKEPSGEAAAAAAAAAEGASPPSSLAAAASRAKAHLLSSPLVANKNSVTREGTNDEAMTRC